MTGLPAAEQPTEAELTSTQREYNTAQAQLFQLAAWGRDSYHRTGELLTREGQQQHAAYRDAIQKAQARFEAAVLAKAADEIVRMISDTDGPAARWDWWDAATIPGSIAEFLRGLAQQIREEQG